MIYCYNSMLFKGWRVWFLDCIPGFGVHLTFIHSVVKRIIYRHILIQRRREFPACLYFRTKCLVSNFFLSLFLSTVLSLSLSLYIYIYIYSIYKWMEGQLFNWFSRRKTFTPLLGVDNYVQSGLLSIVNDWKYIEVGKLLKMLWAVKVEFVSGYRLLIIKHETNSVRLYIIQPLLY